VDRAGSQTARANTSIVSLPESVWSKGTLKVWSVSPRPGKRFKAAGPRDNGKRLHDRVHAGQARAALDDIVPAPRDNVG
jgi:hypothetical protein